MAPLQSQLQGVLYRMRKRRLSRVLLQSLTPWSSGLVCEAGQYVSVANATMVYRALTTGTAGDTEPSGGRTASDGNVAWVLVDIQSLLQYQYSGLPTP